MSQILFVRSAQGRKDIFANLNADMTELYKARVILAANGETAAGTFVVPAGYRIMAIDVVNTTGAAITGGLKFGTTLGGSDVVAALPVDANATTFVPDASFQKRVLSSTGDTTLYVDAVTAWNAASVNVRITIAKTF